MNRSALDITTFSRRTNRGIMLININLPACGQLMRDPHPWLIWAVTMVQSPDGGGFPSVAEEEMLRIEEEDLLSRIQPPHDYLYMGQMVHEGKHVLVLHSRRDDLIGAAPSSRIETTRYTWDIYYKQDPDMDFVRGRLMPTQKEKRRIKDAEVLDILAKAGDRAEQPRTVTFYGLFGSEEAVTQATAALEAAGFRVSPPSALPPSSDAAFSLMFQRTSTLEPARIDAVTNTADRLCEEAGGIFDGWECEPASGG